MDNLRIGIGFDVHKFKKGKKLFLGGVCIPYKFGLLGHSDADVLLHAICDALLGALGKSDIGQYFPDNDPKYKDMPSINFLKVVQGIMCKAKFKPVNVDCIIITDEPKISNFSEKIKANIVRVLCLKRNSIAIKAKTTEGILSYSGKGIAAYCIVLLEGRGGKK